VSLEETVFVLPGGINCQWVQRFTGFDHHLRRPQDDKKPFYSPRPTGCGHLAAGRKRTGNIPSPKGSEWSVHSISRLNDHKGSELSARQRAKTNSIRTAKLISLSLGSEWTWYPSNIHRTREKKVYCWVETRYLGMLRMDIPFPSESRCTQARLPFMAIVENFLHRLSCCPEKCLCVSLVFKLLTKNLYRNIRFLHPTDTT